MNWDAIGAIGEVLGAVAVLITLIYLAIQIRQNTRSVAASAFESAMSGFNEVMRDISTNADLATIVRRGGLDPTSLNEDELFRFNFAVRCNSNHVYKLFRLHQQGVLPRDEWRNVAREAAQVFSMPGYADFTAKNAYYSELWVEIEREGAENVSSFEFGRL
jgi:hypothetical protein